LPSSEQLARLRNAVVIALDRQEKSHRRTGWMWSHSAVQYVQNQLGLVGLRDCPAVGFAGLFMPDTGTALPQSHHEAVLAYRHRWVVRELMPRWYLLFSKELV
jgi:hypothetical protein